MSAAPEKKRRDGFTLVELLVVIGIIAVLISILLPTLSRARESAKRTECLSNMRAIFQMIKIYEITYKGASPLGYPSLEMQASYFLSRGGPTLPSVPGGNVRYTGIGHLILANIAKESITAGRVFYCPSFQGDVNHDYNAPTNPWPPSSPYYDGVAIGSDSGPHGCRMSYSQRPILLPDPQPGIDKIVTRVRYDWKTPNLSPCLEQKWWTGGNVSALQPLSYQFPKLAKLKGAAILSDINAGQGRLVVGHKRGLNVLFNNGGARFVDSSSRFGFRPTKNQSIAELIALETTYGSTMDPLQIQLWLLMDMQ